MSAQILEGPKFRFPIEDKSLGHFFFNCCTQYTDRVCQEQEFGFLHSCRTLKDAAFQIDGTDDKSETYGSVKHRSVRTAIELQKRKITSNDVITVCSANNLDCVIPIIATFYVGARVANVDPTFSVRHAKHLISLVTPKIIFVDQSRVKLIEDVLKDAEFKTEIVVFGTSEKYSIFSDFTKPQEDEENFVPVDVDLDQIAVMTFSSGSTGLPKAICHSHRLYLPIISQACHFGWAQRVIYFTTFYSMTAMTILGGCFHLGSYRVFCRTYDGDEIFQMIEKYNVRCVFMAPSLTYELTRCKNAECYNISSVKVMSTSGTPIAPAQIKALKEMFPHAHVGLLYGMTEMGLVTAFDEKFDKELARTKYTSTGKVAPGCQLKVVDLETRKVLGPNQKGEICGLSASLMKGYYNSDFANLIDEDGFLKSGDIGYYDEDNCWYVVDRIKEMFKYQSWHIIPSALEAVLLEHPFIKEAVVFGVPHEDDGELPACGVVLKDDCNLTENEIDEFVKERVADRERFRGGVFFVESLPKTPTGKIARKQIRDFALDIKKNLGT